MVTLFLFFSPLVLLLRVKSLKVSGLIGLFSQESHWAACTTSASPLMPDQDLMANVSVIKDEVELWGPSISSLMAYSCLSSGCLWQTEKLIAKWYVWGQEKGLRKDQAHTTHLTEILLGLLKTLSERVVNLGFKKKPTFTQNLSNQPVFFLCVYSPSGSCDRAAWFKVCQDWLVPFFITSCHDATCLKSNNCSRWFPVG